MRTLTTIIATLALALAGTASAHAKTCYLVKCGPGKSQCVRIVIPCPHR